MGTGRNTGVRRRSRARITGSGGVAARTELLDDLLRHADREHWRVAIVGGAPWQRETSFDRIVTAWPGVSLIGHWTSARADSGPDASADTAREIRDAEADLVVVCLGSARQQEWIDAYGAATGAIRVVAAEALTDLWMTRIPDAAPMGQPAGSGKMWRLVREPKRWANRYLVEGPPASPAVRRSSAPHSV